MAHSFVLGQGGGKRSSALGQTAFLWLGNGGVTATALRDHHYRTWPHCAVEYMKPSIPK